LKIALVIYGRLETVSGGYLYDRKLVEVLRAAGDTVEIISIPWRNYPAHLTDNFSRRLHRQLTDASLDLVLQDELNHPSLLWINKKNIRRTDHNQSHPTDRPRSVSIVHHLRSKESYPGWQNRLYRAIERGYLRSVDGFIFNSQTTRETVFQLTGPPYPPHLVALPAGDRFETGANIPDAEIITRAQECGPLRLVFLGNLIPRKGLHTLLGALAAVPPGLAELTIIGSADPDPVYARKILARARHPSLAASVRYVGALSDTEVAIQLRRAHMLVAPSVYEGYGIAYLEGMCFGLPAIAGTAGASGEVITHGQDGFLVPTGDVASLSEIICTLATNRQRLATLSLAARQRYLAQPTWEETGNKIREFLWNFLSNVT
jgi:glycosyltransferase involved in cell wall biosynthesis